MTLQITQQQIQQAQLALEQGGAAGMWQYLASQGDSYAASASEIISNPSGFMGSIVTYSWSLTGADL